VKLLLDTHAPTTGAVTIFSLVVNPNKSSTRFGMKPSFSPSAIRQTSIRWPTGLSPRNQSARRWGIIILGRSNGQSIRCKRLKKLIGTSGSTPPRVRRAPFLSLYVAPWLRRLLFVQQCGCLPVIDLEVQQRTTHLRRLTSTGVQGVQEFRLARRSFCFCGMRALCASEVGSSRSSRSSRSKTQLLCFM
jgi:hypothetical protein